MFVCKILYIFILNYDFSENNVDFIIYNFKIILIGKIFAKIIIIRIIIK